MGERAEALTRPLAEGCRTAGENAVTATSKNAVTGTSHPRPSSPVSALKSHFACPPSARLGTNSPGLGEDLPQIPRGGGLLERSRARLRDVKPGVAYLFTKKINDDLKLFLATPGILQLRAWSANARSRGVCSEDGFVARVHEPRLYNFASNRRYRCSNPFGSRFCRSKRFPPTEGFRCAS